MVNRNRINASSRSPEGKQIYQFAHSTIFYNNIQMQSLSKWINLTRRHNVNELCKFAFQIFSSGENAFTITSEQRLMKTFETQNLIGKATKIAQGRSTVQNMCVFLPRFALLILNREPAKASIISGFVVCENSLTRRNKRQHCCSFCRVCLLCNFASNQFSLSLYRLLKLRRNLKLFITERRNVAINRCIVTCTFK